MKRLLGLLALSTLAVAQVRTIGTGTAISIRTNERINVKNSDGRVFTGVVDQDVVDADGRTAIPRGANAELIVRQGSNRDLVLDLESIAVDGQWYAVDVDPNRIGAGQRDNVGKNERTAKYVGSGAVLGAIIGAIAGGGQGAAIGAAAGAGAGASTQILTRGKNVRVPAESLLTFRLEQPLTVGASHNGATRHGQHYHELPR